MYFWYLDMVHDKDATLAFGLGVIVTLSHASNLLSEYYLPCLPYFRVGIPRKFLVPSDGFPCVWIDHCRSEVVDVNLV